MALAREIFKFSKLLNLHVVKKITDASSVQNPSFIVPVRTSKHWNPKWKWLRGKKVIPLELPDFSSSKSSKEKMRTRMKELGIMPPRYWKTRPLTVTSTNEIIDAYIPPEGDGKSSLLSREGARDLATSLTKKKDTMLAIRKIRRYEEGFDAKTFPQHAHDIYVKAHTVLMEKDADELSQYATDKANSDMMQGIKNKTLRWKFIESLEPPIVVHARVTPVITKPNLFAQVTVRFHTKQALAIYDRFGRLFYGSEVLAKDVLEYVIFEKHIVHEYGVWRLHAKIIPDWMSTPEPSARTYRIEEQVVEDDDDDDFIEEDREDELVAETEIVKKESEVRS